MDTNVQALKDLYVALGGEAADVANLETSSEVITAMQAVAAAAATELPVVKKADAGKNLTVNGNGKWAAIMPESPIDDSEASEDTTYSSSKIESIIPEGLPTAPSAGWSSSLTADKNGVVSWSGGYMAGADITDTTMGLFNFERWIKSDMPIICSIQGAPHVFYRVKIDISNTPHVFSYMNISRGENSTIYRYFDVPENASGSYNATLTTVTINDPA